MRERSAAATTHTTAPINHTRPSPRKHSPDGATRARKQTSDYSLLLSLSTSNDERLTDWTQHSFLRFVLLFLVCHYFAPVGMHSIAIVVMYV